MAGRLAALLPRAVVVALVWVLATAAFTFAADTTIIGPTSANSSKSVPAKAPELVVPSVTGQAYVFAKGILEDAGFAWRVEGGVKGYSTNVVSLQRPAPGTRVADTGAPTLTLTMRRGTYPEAGMPENTSPYGGTSIAPPKSPSAATKLASPKVPVARPKVATKPVRKHAHAIKPKRRIARIARTKPTLRHARPPAFVVPGAPREPLDEIPLTVRARRLRWR